MGPCIGDIWVWDLHWCRQLFVWEHDLCLELRVLLDGVALAEGEDSWSWKFRSDGVELVRSSYEVLSRSDQMSVGVSEETINVNLGWKIWASSKVQVFFWQRLLYRIPSRLNLFKHIVITSKLINVDQVVERIQFQSWKWLFHKHMRHRCSFYEWMVELIRCLRR